MVGDNDEKLVCQSFHLTGIDGNPLVSASIHIRYVERRREGINIATDIITDKKGVAEVALPKHVFRTPKQPKLFRNNQL